MTALLALVGAAWSAPLVLVPDEQGYTVQRDGQELNTRELAQALGDHQMLEQLDRELRQARWATAMTLTAGVGLVAAGVPVLLGRPDAPDPSRWLLDPEMYSDPLVYARDQQIASDKAAAAQRSHDAAVRSYTLGAVALGAAGSLVLATAPLWMSSTRRQQLQPGNYYPVAPLQERLDAPAPPPPTAMVPIQLSLHLSPTQAALELRF